MHFKDYTGTRGSAANSATLEPLAAHFIRTGAVNPGKAIPVTALTKLLREHPFSYTRQAAYRMLGNAPGFAPVTSNEGELAYYYEYDLAKPNCKGTAVYPSNVTFVAAYAKARDELQKGGSALSGNPSTLREAFKALYDLLPPAAKGEQAVNAAHAVIAEHGITPTSRQALLVIVADMFNSPTS